MMHENWLRKPDNDLTVIFIHGFNSSEECWRHPNGTYWPELLKAENDLSSIGIYVFSYRTGISTGNYSLQDVVDSLKEYLFEDNVLDNSQVIFVCHSMGGIVARRFLVSRQLDLLKKGLKEADLFLIASPSLGSEYATRLSWISKIMGHTQAEALRFSEANTWLNDLDKDFVHLRDSGELTIKGKELVEDHQTPLKGFLKVKVVKPFAANRYFDEPYKVPASDHFTIARPESAKSIQHRLLCSFIKKMKDEHNKSEEMDLVNPQPPNQVSISKESEVEKPQPDIASSISELHQRLNRTFDDPQLDTFLLIYFPDVYDLLSRGMRKDEKLRLLLDHCRRSRIGFQYLVSCLELKENE